jgi:hypothetical protein
MVYAEVMQGNIPGFLRQLIPVTTTREIGGVPRTATVFALPDYLALGNDADYFLMPMTPLCAQRIANALRCTMPTRRLVDTIWARAAVKLRPQPIPPSAEMITVPVFAAHNDSVRQQRALTLATEPLGKLVGGGKKDLILSNQITTNLKAGVPRPVVIYGWHYQNGVPIQPVYNGHGETYADYSHGVRLLLDSMLIDGVPSRVTDCLRDPVLHPLVSDEGTITQPWYSLASLAPAPPGSFGLLPADRTTLRVALTPLPGISYTAYLGRDGVTFPDSVRIDQTGFLLAGLPADSLLYVRLSARDETGTSPMSEVLAGVPHDGPTELLLVHGFDRASAGNQKDFIRMHARSVRAAGRTLASATNDAVAQGIVPLAPYPVADYILGDESTADETFGAVEQEVVAEYLRNGGFLIASGSEIAWDLDAKGSSADSLFLSWFLKSRYVNDAPAGQSGVWYHAEPVAPGPFAGLAEFLYDDGTHGTINVKWPDVLEPVEGGSATLNYSGVPGATAGVAFKGLFPGGARPGGVSVFGFPLESVTPDPARDSLFARLFSWCFSPLDAGEAAVQLPHATELLQNFPNPFNPTTTLEVRMRKTERVLLKVLDEIGREVATLVNEEKPPGTYRVRFDGTGLASGVYFARLQTGSAAQTRRMLLLR